MRLSLLWWAVIQKSRWIRFPPSTYQYHCVCVIRSRCCCNCTSWKLMFRNISTFAQQTSVSHCNCCVCGVWGGLGGGGCRTEWAFRNNVLGNSWQNSSFADERQRPGRMRLGYKFKNLCRKVFHWVYKFEMYFSGNMDWVVRSNVSWNDERQFWLKRNILGIFGHFLQKMSKNASFLRSLFWGTRLFGTVFYGSTR